MRSDLRYGTDSVAFEPGKPIERLLNIRVECFDSGLSETLEKVNKSDHLHSDLRLGARMLGVTPR